MRMRELRIIISIEIADSKEMFKVLKVHLKFLSH